MLHKIRKTIFRINNEIITSVNADEQSLCEIEGLKCAMAIQFNVNLDEIEVEYKEELIELGDTFVGVTGKWCTHGSNWVVEQIEGLSFFFWINPKTIEGLDMICDFVKIGKGDELVKFNSKSI
ncbi:MAG TPA: hypothetical protein VMX17_08225 [Candidatus Glassbacteria bacterium]|nr:hypothetical protein [Candidatus Glassbacteria bacterium]